MDNMAVVEQLWAALAARDWDGVAATLADDAIYFDVPVGPAASAKGPADIVTRLKIGLAPLASYTNTTLAITATGDTVMVEHHETWMWATGEQVTLPFATVHRVVDGKVTVWKDYWDYNTLLSGAPANWLESLAGADRSWIYDATGEV